ncbi:MAG: hypothetical protein JWN67_2854 [Actinomycetia bacterium]|nr:hypothetical protein [Actinomycetes bacterium]
MTETGRRVRMAAVVVVLTLLAGGSLWGSDHDFPFGPFRMYATSGRVNGAVRTASLVGVVGGRAFTIQPEAIGVRRAELEGQYDRFEQDPRLLGTLARAYRRTGVQLDELRLVERVRRLRNRKRVGKSTSEVLVVWKRPR